MLVPKSASHRPKQFKNSCHRSSEFGPKTARTPLTEILSCLAIRAADQANTHTERVVSAESLAREQGLYCSTVCFRHNYLEPRFTRVVNKTCAGLVSHLLKGEHKIILSSRPFLRGKQNYGELDKFI